MTTTAICLSSIDLNKCISSFSLYYQYLHTTIKWQVRIIIGLVTSQTHQQLLKQSQIRNSQSVSMLTNRVICFMNDGVFLILIYKDFYLIQNTKLLILSKTILKAYNSKLQVRILLLLSLLVKGGSQIPKYSIKYVVTNQNLSQCWVTFTILAIIT